MPVKSWRVGKRCALVSFIILSYLKSLSSALRDGENLFYWKNISYHTIYLLSKPEDVVVSVVHKRLSVSFHRPKRSLAPRLSPEPTQPLIVAVAPPPVLFSKLQLNQTLLQIQNQLT